MTFSNISFDKKYFLSIISLYKAIFYFKSSLDENSLLFHDDALINESHFLHNISLPKQVFIITVLPQIEHFSIFHTSFLIIFTHIKVIS